MRYDRRQRRRGLIAPNRVDRVVDLRGQRTACLDCGRGIALDLADRVKPRIVAEHLARTEMGGYPIARRLFCKMAKFEERGIGFGPQLEGVATIDKDGR